MTPDALVAILLVVGTFAACLLHAVRTVHRAPGETYDWKGDAL